MTANIKEEILSSEILKKIKNEPKNLWNHLSTETPVEWTLDGVSELTGENYKYLSIDTLEFLMELIFHGNYGDKISFQSVSVQGNTATVSISVEIRFMERAEDLEQVSFIEHHKSGTASITVMDNFYFDKEGKMKFYDKAKRPIRAAQLLRTATPLCLTEARKNAMKNICNLFGRNLNREVLELVPQEAEKEKAPADIIIMRQYENAIKNKDEKSIREIEAQYNIKTK